MERLTTDNPQSLTENLMNLAYAEDNWVQIRAMDTDFMHYILQQCRMQNCELESAGGSKEELCEIITECGFDFPECPIFLLHAVATQAAELRSRLKLYEDAAEKTSKIK